MNNICYYFTAYDIVYLFVPSVVNKYNQCVGTITRDDLVPEAIAKNMITKGKNV